MKNQFTVTRLIQNDVQEVFNHFVNPRLLERWAYPSGMTLKIPYFEAKKGGNYRFQHSAKNGPYLCTGTFKEYVPNKKLVQEDHIVGPDGNVIYEKLESVTTFTPEAGGTLISITQSGLTDEEAMHSCETGRDESLDNLESLLRGREALSA